MRLTLPAALLAQELRLINRVVAAKPAVPILMNVLLRTSQEMGEGVVGFLATNLEVGVQSMCAATVEIPGACTLPAKKLLDIVSQLSGTVEIEVVGRAALIACGAFRTQLHTQDAEDFPVMPHAPEGEREVLQNAAFQAMIRRCRFAVPDAGKPGVCGAQLTFVEQAVAMVTTDGKRLALTTMARAASTVPLETIVPAQALDALPLLHDETLGRVAGLSFCESEKHLFFISGQRTLFATKMEQRFPNFQRVIPRDNDKTATVGRNALAAALRRVGCVSEESLSAYFDFEAERLTVRTQAANLGAAEEQVPIQYAGLPISVCCSWKSVLDFLELAQGAAVTLSLKHDNTPMLMTDGDEYLVVAVLVRA